jgi:hypothetical protein
MGWFSFGRKEPPSPPPTAIAPATAAAPVAPATQPAPPSSEPIVARETPAEPTKDRPYFPDPLATAEQQLINTRRVSVDRDPAAPQIGVGLSGGGIRSATFCFGIFTALARKLDDGSPPLFTRVDYLSTVSGGGYFGSFLGALFRRKWVKSADDVAKVLRDELGPEGGQRPTRFLRDNGRYLAPRGSGDLLMMLAVMLRNWISVQCVMIAFVLAAFVLLQVVLLNLPAAIGSALSSLNALPNWLPGPLASWARPIVDGAAALVAMTPPDFGSLWWSAWFLLLIPIVLLWAVPTVWAYWVIDQPLSNATIVRRSDLLVLGGVAAGALFGFIPQPMPRFLALLALAALATTLWTLWGHPWLVRGVIRWIASWFRREAERSRNDLYDASAARRRVSSALKTSLIACAAIVVLALIDTLGATVYVVLKTGGAKGLIAAIGAAIGTFAGVAAYGRQLLVLFSGDARDKQPRVSMSIVSWIVAIVVIGAWLITTNVVSHAIAWQFQSPSGYPAKVTETAVPKLTDAQEIVIKDSEGSRTIKAVVPLAKEQKQTKRDMSFALKVLGILVALIALLGRNTFFINLSTMHTFYTQRLTRAYLGATNSERLCSTKTHVTDVISGDDVAADQYWRWPLSPHVGIVDTVRSTAKRAGAWLRDLPKNVRNRLVSLFRGEPPPKVTRAPEAPQPFPSGHNGSPLHIVNVTINETFDNRTGIQVQDRKGVPLAVGPAGLSVGVRHHLVADADPKKGHIALPSGDGHCVFESKKLKGDPEALSLGRWVSISGAAAGSAVGSRTTLPTAMLATFANVRLGYWWNSGLDLHPTGFFRKLLPPVYRALMAEFLCNLRGTGDRLWNLSDGGHFENLGGYELIRRRLPLIILIDAEQDTDYKFSGLADLIRKARLDFGAEIEFVDPQTVRKHLKDAEVLEFFGTLGQLRRVDPSALEKSVSSVGLELPASREALSRAHAAIARVTYADNQTPPSWLIYVKATLTGDEPVDVLEYHSSHPDFPHESTANQFFDEAQWESYRRLGEHIGCTVLTPDIFDLAGKGRDDDRMSVVTLEQPHVRFRL